MQCKTLYAWYERSASTVSTVCSEGHVFRQDVSISHPNGWFTGRVVQCTDIVEKWKCNEEKDGKDIIQIYDAWLNRMALHISHILWVAKRHETA